MRSPSSNSSSAAILSVEAAPRERPSARVKGRLAAAALLLALGGCDLFRDCSLAARLEAHAAERERFRTKLGILSRDTHCYVMLPPALLREAERISIIGGRIRRRIATSELRGDLEQVEREQQEMSNSTMVDCVGAREWSERDTSEARAAYAVEMQRLRALDAEFQLLARRLADC